MIFLFLAGFIMVALRSIQQLNVIHDRKWFVVPTSLMMAAAEATIIVKMAEGWTFGKVLIYGLSAGFGCLTAMVLHKRLRGGRPRGGRP